MENEAIARVCHEVNRAYCQAIGDNSQLPWEIAPQWQRDSAINGVAFHQANPLTVPEDSHAEWMRNKIADGWKWGSVKNESKKEHHCIVPYDQLPVEQRAKDYLFRAVVHALR